MTSSAAPSRRAILAGALGGIGAAVAAAARPLTRAAAADGDPITVGGDVSGTLRTRLSSSVADNALEVVATSSANGTVAVNGRAEASNGNTYGVWGLSQSETGIGVLGEASASLGTGIGVWGNSSGPGGRAVVGESFASNGETIGVDGKVFSDGGIGVRGTAEDAGIGVRGDAPFGIGLSGVSANGFALRTDGRVKLDKVSGVATIPAGSDRVVVTPGLDVTNSSFVLLTPKANLGTRALWYATNPTGNTFTVRMSSARAKATKVAWLLIG